VWLKSSVLLGFFAITLSPALGQYVRVVQACSQDFAKLCAAAQAEGSLVGECFESQFSNFSASCKSAIIRIGAVREACESDIEQQCAAQTPGAGRILLCVKGNFSLLSEPCRSTIGQAAKRSIETHRHH
jgi:hypothetical protein